MNKEINYETFLFVGLKKFIISVNYKDNFRTIYKIEKNFSNELNKFQFEKLINFLDENIFYIEKKFNFFIQNIYIILEHNEFIPIGIGIKKQNYGKILLKDDIIYSLNEIKNYCKKTFDEKRIIHMLIDNYIVDNKIYSLLPENLKSNNFAIDLKFICLSKSIIKDLEEILKKYQIAIQQLVESSYVSKLSLKSNDDIFLTTKKTVEGSNINEVKLLEKTSKNKGFFERFFNLFS
tara:strand:+ start:335 stop:1039 length:705 start_codon:yes stop_codon:yes gene_type:complete